MRITVFTPAFNRGYIIEKLYRSLQKQTFRDFEWIVIDDGSTDDTSDKIKEYINEKNDFPIVFQRVENGGKHRAINRGVQKAKGTLFFIVDSDDYLTDNALEIIDKIERTIPEQNKSKFAGVCGARGFSSEKIIGTTFEGKTLDATMLEREKNGIRGDKAEVFYTEVLKKYPFPEFEGEKFLTECIVWDKIANDGYKLRFFNEIIYVCNYLPDGLSLNLERAYEQSPKGYGLYLYQSRVYNKMQGVNMWNQYLKYFYMFRKKYPFKDIAQNLHMNPVKLFVRLFGIRLFYKMYDS